jgi:hypothetical protein
MAMTNVRRSLGDDPNFLRVKYVRYVDDFLIGIIGPRTVCVKVRKEIKNFLEDRLKLTLNVDKTKITHAIKESALFLGYNIHGTQFNRRPVTYGEGKTLKRRSPRPIMDAPMDRIVKRLYENGYCRKNGNPTRNGKFINHTLPDLINHFRSVERGVLNYYGLASNYGRVAARVHYIIKYSCALTICSKMRLRTLRRTFRKYGRYLEIKEENKKLAFYPTVSYKKPRKLIEIKDVNPDDIIRTLTYCIKRGRRDLQGPCIRCGSNHKIEIHHVKKLSLANKGDFLDDMMRRMNRKQVPLCAVCHRKVHAGEV